MRRKLAFIFIMTHMHFLLCTCPSIFVCACSLAFSSDSKRLVVSSHKKTHSTIHVFALHDDDSFHHQPKYGSDHFFLLRAFLRHGFICCCFETFRFLCMCSSNSTSFVRYCTRPDRLFGLEAWLPHAWSSEWSFARFHADHPDSIACFTPTSNSKFIGLA